MQRRVCQRVAEGGPMEGGASAAQGDGGSDVRVALRAVSGIGAATGRD